MSEISDQDVDIFLGRDPNYRWDMSKNSNLLNIVFLAGTFGHFLRFYLDKFSKLTPDISGDPFTETGISHGKLSSTKTYSGKIQKYHMSFVNENKGLKNLNICLISPTSQIGYLYIKPSHLFRAGDRRISPDDLWKNNIKELLQSELKPKVEEILNLYELNKQDQEYIPKFIVRDWYKLEFLSDLKTQYNYRLFKKYREHPFFTEQNIHCLPLECFFNFDEFKKNMEILDKKYQLNLDFGREDEMRSLFLKGIELDIYRKQVQIVSESIECLDSTRNIEFETLDVVMEAFLYAHIEKTNPEISAPLTNQFFKDTDEIREYVKNYPNWYKRPNPNLKNGQK